MNIYSLPIIFFLILILDLTLVGIIYKFIISDFFVEKTGIKTFYYKNGKKKVTDKINILSSNLVAIVPFSVGLLFHYFSYDFFSIYDILFMGFSIYTVFFIYILICLYLRITFLPFKDEKPEEERTYPFSYTITSIKLDLIINMQNVVFLMFYLIFEIKIGLYCFIIGFIYLHVFTLFPDYVNIFWPNEIRTKKGWNSLMAFDFIINGGEIILFFMGLSLF